MTDKGTLLIADDEATAREGLRRGLQGRYNIIEASDGQETWDKIVNEAPDLLLLDIYMPKLSGLKILERIQTVDAPPLVVVLTAYGSEKIAVDAMKAGAYDYIAKPCDLDEVRMTLLKAYETIELQKEVQQLKEVIAGKSEFLVGHSKSLDQVRDLIKKVASTDVTVLITGESGTGKELVAKEIHREGNRSDVPFVVMNCAALPKDLIESELFGYAKGAFTGAAKDTPGKFELAHGGTLFLDEIGDMSLDTQSKVLRAIEERRVTPLGAGKTTTVEVRIIAATNQDLQRAVQEGRFREDLYYRIRVVEIPLPPLRKRDTDILLLAQHFLRLFSTKHDKQPLTLTPSVVTLLEKYRWPGNVRELRNLMENLVVLSDESLDESILKGELSGTKGRRYSLQGRTFQDAKQSYLGSVETSLVLEALEETGGNITKAATILGMKRQYLQQKLKQLNINPGDYSPISTKMK